MIKKFVSMNAAILLLASGISFIGTTTASAVDVWTSRTSADETANWRSVVYGAGLWVAVAESGTNRVMTSPDGITWTPRTAAEANAWNSVAYGNNLFVAVASTGTNRVMTSPDGITWTARTAPAKSWNSVAYGNNLFVAVGFGATAADSVMTSPDGITWTARTAVELATWNSVAYGNGRWVAVNGNGTSRVMTSTNGTTWSTVDAVAANNWQSVAYGNGLWVAVSTNGTNRVMTSPDGITWTGRTHARNLSWRSVAYGNDLWVAVGSDSSNRRVMTSPDGITWTEQTAAAENFWRSVAFGNNLFVAVSTSGTNRVMTAPATITPPTTASSTPTPTAAEIAAAAAAADQAFGEGLRLRKMISAQQNLSSAFLGDKSGSIDDFRDANITVTTTASLIRINAEILKLSGLDRIDFAKIKVLAERIEFDESFFNAAARPAASTYATYGVAGVTDRILAKVNAQVLELPGAQRLDTKAITEIANVESFIDRVANTETRASVSASLLISKGLVPADYPKKHSLIQGLGSYPEDNLNTMAKIQAAIKAEIAKAQAPRLRTAEIKARIAARNK